MAQNEMGSRAQSRQRAALRHRRMVRRRVVLAVLCLLLAGAAVVLLWPRPVRDASLEAGGTITPALFVRSVKEDTRFESDVSAIDTARPGEYEVRLFHGGRSHTVTLTVKDTVPPTATGRTMAALLGAELSPVECVQDVQDVTQVTAQWKSAPDVNRADEQQTAVVRLTDEGGNTTDVQVLVTMRQDPVPPVITGAADIEAFVGDSIAYREGVTVTDDADPAPLLEVDSSGVNMNAAGVYTAVYTASDAAGNTASVPVTVTLRDKPPNYVDEQTVYETARACYDEIISDDMTDMEKAFAIYRWVKGFIDYQDGSAHDYWTVGAYQAFTTMMGDCYIYYSAARALLNMAGIANLEVVKSDTSRSEHYWLLIDLGYGWYHLDPCPRKGIYPDNTFMLTDAELEDYSRNHLDSNVFDPDLYPERAVQSVQQYVDYEGHAVHDPGW